MATRAGSGMFRINQETEEFMLSGVVTVVGTGDATGGPHAAIGWAPRVCDNGATVDVFLDAARSERTLENLRANGRIAVTMMHPVSYRSLQLKGTFRDSAAADAEDDAWVRQQREAFTATASLVGEPPSVLRNVWLEDVVRVTFAVERAFDQTPGPEAGTAL